MTDRSDEPLLVDDNLPKNRHGGVNNLLKFVRDQMAIGERLSSSEIAKRVEGVARCNRSMDSYKVQSVLKRCPYVRMIPRGRKLEGGKQTTKVAQWERVPYDP